jgi:hypothetical protein
MGRSPAGMKGRFYRTDAVFEHISMSGMEHENDEPVLFTAKPDSSGAAS